MWSSRLQTSKHSSMASICILQLIIMWLRNRKLREIHFVRKKSSPMNGFIFSNTYNIYNHGLPMMINHHIYDLYNVTHQYMRESYVGIHTIVKCKSSLSNCDVCISFMITGHSYLIARFQKGNKCNWIMDIDCENDGKWCYLWKWIDF